VIVATAPACSNLTVQPAAPPLATSSTSRAVGFTPAARRSRQIRQSHCQNALNSTPRSAQKSPCCRAPLVSNASTTFDQYPRPRRASRFGLLPPRLSPRLDLPARYHGLNGYGFLGVRRRMHWLDHDPDWTITRLAIVLESAPGELETKTTLRRYIPGTCITQSIS
jgi:hypothetical protein